MIFTLLTVAQLTMTQPTGIPLAPVYTITEPADIQPALGVNVLQETANPQDTLMVGELQPAEHTGLLQQTMIVWQLQETLPVDL